MRNIQPTSYSMYRECCADGMPSREGYICCSMCQSNPQVKTGRSRRRGEQESGCGDEQRRRRSSRSLYACAQCPRPPSPDKQSKQYNQLLDTIEALNDKIHYINNKQLPKLRQDLQIAKSLADRLSKQNSDLSRKDDHSFSEGRGQKPTHCCHCNPPNSSQTMNRAKYSKLAGNKRNRKRRKPLLVRVILYIKRKMTRVRKRKI